MVAERSHEPESDRAAPEAEAAQGVPARVPEAQRLASAIGNRRFVALLQRETPTASATASPAAAASRPKLPKGYRFVNPNDKRWVEVMRMTEWSALGWDAKKVMEANHVEIAQADPVPGQADKSAPAFYSFQINVCFLNLDKPAHEVSAYFVHEMHHASQHHEHNSPKAWEVSNRGKWVRMMVEEEVIGTAKGFEHKRRIENNNVAPKDNKPDGMANYRRTFNYWRDQVKKEGGTDFEAGEKGREMGTARVRLMIKDPHEGRQTAELGPPGGVGESYEGWYTREWEDEQRKHAKTPP